MDLQIFYRAGAYIRNTLKRALEWDHEEYLYCSSKRFAPQGSLHEASRLISFMKVLENPAMKSFLRFDTCYLLADNYLIATAYIYLDRAKILLSEFSVHYFLSALYLAHEIQEDIEDIRQNIVAWYPGDKKELKALALHFFKTKLWFQMNFKCHVSKRQCDKLMQQAPKLDIWQRKREESHSGAFYPFAFRRTKCKHCDRRNFYNPLVVRDSPHDDKNEKSLVCEENDTLITSDWEDEAFSDADSVLT